jgi:hypothetical protein
MKNKPYLHSLLFCTLVLSLAACEVTEEETQTSNHPVVIENQYAENIAIEFWRGDGIHYDIDNREVTGKIPLEKANYLEVDAESTTSLDKPVKENLFAIVGVEFNDRYEYLTQTQLPSVANGTAIRLDRKGVLSIFPYSPCIQDLSDGEIAKTLNINSVVEKISGPLASRWQPLQIITSPLSGLYEFSQNISKHNLSFGLSSIEDWSFSDGIYTHTETIEDATYTIEVRYYWGAGSNNNAKGDLITHNLSEPSNYISNPGLDVNISSIDTSATDITSLDINLNDLSSLDISSIDTFSQGVNFTFDQIGPLSPLVGIPEGQTSPYNISISDWVGNVMTTYNSLEMGVEISVDHQESDDNLNFALNYHGPTRHTIAFNPLALEFNLEKTQFNLTLDDPNSIPEGGRISRTQIMDITEWNQKIFLAEEKAEGSGKYTVTGDSNFDFNGTITYDSDPNTPPAVFVECSVDNSPIIYQ